MSENEGFGGAEETMKALGLGDFKGIKTFAAEASKTIYGIIAEEKGLTLSVSPRLSFDFHPIIGLYVRVRAQKKEEWANLADAGDIFGIPEFIEKSPNHSSIEFFVFPAVHPVTPYAVGQTLETNKLFDKLVDDIANRVEQAGAKLIVERPVIVEYLKGQLESILPSTPGKQPTEFPILVGPEAVMGKIKEMLTEFGFKK